MPGRIFIECYPIEVLGLDSPVVHLYLVHRDTNGVEHVLRSGPSNDLPIFGADMLVEVNTRIERSVDARGAETPESRLSREIALPDLTVDAAWSLMVRYAEQIDEADYGYDLFNQNSNTFIGALLAAAGGQPLDLLPAGIDADAAFGVSDFSGMLGDLPPPEDGVLRGTSGDDLLTGIQVGERILGRAGADTVLARRGNDTVFGGGDDDVLKGGAGRDHLSGGRGADLLEDGGGRDVLSGGAGADVFVLVADGRFDRIEDFQQGRDLIDLSAADVSGFGALDLAVTEDGILVSYGAERLLVVSAEDILGADDFVFG